MMVDTMSNISVPPPVFDWLAGDLHNHCESHELVNEHFTGLDERLDFVALTNHANKAMFVEQVDMVAQARTMVAMPVLFGLEWNAAAGIHACVIFPPCLEEAELAMEFIETYDRSRHADYSDVEAAIRWLRELPEALRPVVFFNHPHPGHWSAEVVDRYLAADPAGDVVAGIETVAGHQCGCPTDPHEFPGCRPNGLADQAYVADRPFTLFANSDFHVHKQQKFYDYPLGVWSRSLIGVPSGDRSAAAVFAGIRAGRSWAMLGDWLTPREMSVGKVAQGGVWDSSTGVGDLRLRLALREPVTEVAVIGRLDADTSPAVLHDFGGFGAGELDLTWPIPAEACGYVRLRITAAGELRPPVPAGFPGETIPGLTMGHSSAVFISNGREP